MKTRSSKVTTEQIPPRPETGMGAPAVPSSTSSVVIDPPCLPRSAELGGAASVGTRLGGHPQCPRILQPARYCGARTVSDASGSRLSVVLTLPGVDLLVSKGTVSDG